MALLSFAATAANPGDVFASLSRLAVSQLGPPQSRRMTIEFYGDPGIGMPGGIPAGGAGGGLVRVSSVVIISWPLNAGSL